jgi:hypothetical protein
MRTAEYVTPIAPGVFSNPTLTVDSQGLVVATAGGATTAQCIIGYQDTSQTTSVGANTDLPFDASHRYLNYDPAGMFDGTSTITIPTAGRYLVNYNVTLYVITPTSICLCNAGVNIGAETFGVPDLNTRQYFNTTSVFNFVGGETLTLRNVRNTETYLLGIFAVVQLTT